MLALVLLGCPPSAVEPGGDAGEGDAGAAAAGGDASTEALSAILSARRVLCVGAHPDDEVYLAPLLYALCQRRGAA